MGLSFGVGDPVSDGLTTRLRHFVAWAARYQEAARGLRTIVLRGADPEYDQARDALEREFGPEVVGVAADVRNRETWPRTQVLWLDVRAIGPHEIGSWLGAFSTIALVFAKVGRLLVLVVDETHEERLAPEELRRTIAWSSAYHPARTSGPFVPIQPWSGCAPWAEPRWVAPSVALVTVYRQRAPDLNIAIDVQPLARWAALGCPGRPDTAWEQAGLVTERVVIEGGALLYDVALSLTGQRLAATSTPVLIDASITALAREIDERLDATMRAELLRAITNRVPTRGAQRWLVTPAGEVTDLGATLYKRITHREVP